MADRRGAAEREREALAGAAELRPAGRERDDAGRARDGALLRLGAAERVDEEHRVVVGLGRGEAERLARQAARDSIGLDLVARTDRGGDPEGDRREPADDQDHAQAHATPAALAPRRAGAERVAARMRRLRRRGRGTLAGRSPGRGDVAVAPEAQTGGQQ